MKDTALMNSNDLSFMTRAEVCSLLHVGPTALWSYMKSGKLRYRRIGRKLLFVKDEVLEDASRG